MRAAFAGGATLERDEAARRGVIHGAGQDALSSSRARGEIAYQLADVGGGATRIAISVEYSLQGPLAQFSRGGLVKEFVGRMVAEFAPKTLDAQLAERHAPHGGARRGRACIWRWLWSAIQGGNST